MNWKEIIYGSADEQQDVRQILADWRTESKCSSLASFSDYHFDEPVVTDRAIARLRPYAQRWAGDGEQSRILILQTRKLLLANNPDRVEKLWSASAGGMRHWGGIWCVFKEQWFGA